MTDDSLDDVQPPAALAPYAPSAAAIAAFDYVDALHLFMLALLTGDVDGLRAAIDNVDDAARRMHAASQ